MTRTALLTILSVVLASPVTAQTPWWEGRFAIAPDQADTVSRAIERVVAGAPLIRRVLLRSALRRLNPGAHGIRLEREAGGVALTVDTFPRLLVPFSGPPAIVPRSMGDSIFLQAALDGGVLTITERSKSGLVKVSRYTPSPDGSQLTLTAVTSGQDSLVYRLTFNREPPVPQGESPAWVSPEQRWTTLATASAGEGGVAVFAADVRGMRMMGLHRLAWYRQHVRVGDRAPAGTTFVRARFDCERGSLQPLRVEVFMDSTLNWRRGVAGAWTVPGAGTVLEGVHRGVCGAPMPGTGATLPPPLIPPTSAPATPTTVSPAPASFAGMDSVWRAIPESRWSRVGPFNGGALWADLEGMQRAESHVEVWLLHRYDPRVVLNEGPVDAQYQLMRIDCRRRRESLQQRVYTLRNAPVTWRTDGSGWIERRYLGPPFSRAFDEVCRRVNAR